MPMPQPKFASNPAVDLAKAPAVAPRTPGAGGIAAIADPIGIADSPARQLHDLLVETFSTPVRDIDDRWPAPARFGFIIGASLLLWCGIGAAVAAVIF